jgi:hypothetical protein
MKYTSRRPQVQAWQRLIGEFEKAFDIRLEKFQKYPQWLVRRTLAERMGFGELFRKLGTKDLYIVNAYSEPSIVLGAHRAGVRVHEIQHGFISAFHPAYSFAAPGTKPDRKPNQSPKLDAAPDEILTWGSFWGSGVSLARGTQLRVSGPTAPFREYRQKALAENRVGRIDQVAEKVNVVVDIIDGGDLNGRHHCDPFTVSSCNCLLHPGDCVVVGQGENLDPGLRCARDDLGRVKGSVGVDGMGLQVKCRLPHRHDRTPDGGHRREIGSSL